MSVEDKISREEFCIAYFLLFLYYKLAVKDSVIDRARFIIGLKEK